MANLRPLPGRFVKGYRVIGLGRLGPFTCVRPRSPQAAQRRKRAGGGNTGIPDQAHEVSRSTRAPSSIVHITSAASDSHAASCSRV
jgi:hypothetical protein